MSVQAFIIDDFPHPKIQYSEKPDYQVTRDKFGVRIGAQQAGADRVFDRALKKFDSAGRKIRFVGTEIAPLAPS
jgi:hypothetical protein